MRNDDSNALHLYVILDRDTADFTEALHEATDNTLDILKQMLELPNSKHDTRAQAVNAIGASIVRAVIEGRAEAALADAGTKPIDDAPQTERHDRG